MANIGNRFFVTALDDGTTLHGNLSVDGSLSQAWNQASLAAVPDWSTSGTTGKEAQPTIMLTLLSGSTYIGTDSSSPNGYISEAKWYYNDNGTDSEILFSSTTTTITVGSSTVTGYLDTNMGQKFLKTTKSLNGVTVPALRVIQNLASSNNVDLDTITFKGKYNSGSGILDFQASAQIRISRMSSGGYIGVIDFLGGVSDITSKPQTITMTGTLYDSAGDAVSSTKTRWYLNGAVHRELNQSDTVTVSDTDVIDNAVVQCDFFVVKDGVDTFVYSAFASIDDMTDNEFMYIQYAGANGNAASLRKGQSVTFEIWVGKTTDATVDTSFAYFQVQLIGGDGNVITGSVGTLPPDQGNGWRNLTVDGTSHKASLTISYDLVNAYNKNITGILRASTGAFQQ